MSEALNKIKKYEQETLQGLLEQCTQKQQEFFKRMYPEGITNLETKEMHRAIKQCEATIKLNKEKIQQQTPQPQKGGDSIE